MKRIHENDIRLKAARDNLTHARHALNISIITAYKNPQPDPLQAALEARNFGQVLEQFALLDRANSYNASILTDIRDYQKQVDRSQRTLNHERNTRRDNVAELSVAKAQIDSSIAADKRATAVCAQGAPLDRRAARGREGAVAGDRRADAPAAGDLERPRSRSTVVGAQPQTRRRRDADGAAALDAGRGGRERSAQGARHAVRLGRRCARRLRLLGPRLLGLRAGGPGWAAALHRRALGLGHAHLGSELAPGDLVFYNGLNHVGMYIGGGNFVEAPHTGDVVKISSMASRSGFVGAVRVTG